MKRIETPLKDAFIIEQKLFKDDRGFFVESYNERDFREVGLHENFCQDNHSYSTVNVLRGLHYQVTLPQGKLVRCIDGRIVDVIVDLRESSPTFGQHFKIDLHSPEKMLWVPAGFAHGFYVLSPSCHISYKTTEYYYPEFDRTLIWNDSTLGIEWPTNTPILSAKDELGKTFEKCEKYE